MAGNTSKIQLISNALILLGDAPISALTDSGAGAIAGANLYDSSYINMLSMHRWRFATKKAKLARLSETPQSEYKYQYQMPSDLVMLQNTTAERDFDIYEDKIYTNYKELEIEYTYKVKEDFLPAYFIKTFEFFLAAQFAIPVTGNTTRANEYLGMYNSQLRKAKALDSTSRPAQQIKHNLIADIFS